MAEPQPQPVPDAALFQQLGIDDPRLIQLAQLMSRQAAPIEDDEGEVIEMVRADRVEELENEVERLKGVNRILFEQCEFMAAAVGACPQCWGEDLECRECRGRGTPGAFLPHRASFAQLVLPAVERVRTLRRRQAPPPQKTAEHAPVE
jgi:hypothetical protein